MKCKFLGLVAIMAAICLICSCGNGSSDSEGAAQKTVAVSFAVSTENGALRTLAVDFDGIKVDKYQYKATPLFSSEFGDPQGVQTTWKDFTYDTTAGKGSVGEFAQGKWKFEVQCLQNVEGANPVVVYATAAAVETYINASTTTVEVTVVRQKVEGTGTLVIDDVTAPAYSEWAEGDCDYLVITGATFGSENSYTIYSSGTGDDNRSTFADDGIEVAAGIYTMTFTVYDKDDKKVGAATKVVEIGVGVETTVSGALDAGTWVEGFLSVVVKTIELEVTAPTEAQSVVAGKKVAFAFTGTIKEGDTAVTDEDITYTLYYNDSAYSETVTKASGTAASLDWDTTGVAPGYYEVHIIASNEDGTLTTDGGDEAVILVTVNPAE